MVMLWKVKLKEKIQECHGSPKNDNVVEVICDGPEADDEGTLIP